MKTVKISPVQYEMLVVLGKKKRMKPQDLIIKLITAEYYMESKGNIHIYK